MRTARILLGVRFDICERSEVTVRLSSIVSHLCNSSSCPHRRLPRRNACASVGRLGEHPGERKVGDSSGSGEPQGAAPPAKKLPKPSKEGTAKILRELCDRPNRGRDPVLAAIQSSMLQVAFNETKVSLKCCLHAYITPYVHIPD
jgi:hypothetical protein